MNHTLTPERTDAEVEALIGGYDGYDRQDDIAVDYHLAGVVVYNYATQESLVFTEAQLQILVDLVSLHPHVTRSPFLDTEVTL